MILVACGHAPAKEAPDAPDVDAAVTSDGRSTCSDGSAARAVLVAISANDEVDLYTLQDGHLVATGSPVTGIDRPNQIVMRDDGREALTIYGGYGSPFGVAVITVSDGSIQLAQKLQIGTDSTAISIAYADRDHAVIALEAQNDEIVGIARGASGFTAGPRVPAPASFPLWVRARPGSADVLLARSEVGVDPTMDIYRLDATSTGTWKSAGAHTSVGPNPIEMALHSSGNALYVPTGDPSNPVSAKNLDAPSLLHAVAIGSDSFTAAGTVTLPRIASLVTADPLGRFVVTEGNHYILDGNGNPNVIGYNFQTVLLTPDGALGEVHATMDPTAGLLFDDLELAPSGHLLAAREMYEGSVPPAMQYPLELWAQPEWGAWTLCDTAYLSGGGHVAIAR